MRVIGGSHGLSLRLICGCGCWEGVCISWCLGGFVERYVRDHRQRDGEKFDEAFHQKRLQTKRNNGVSENMRSGSWLQLGVHK